MQRLSPHSVARFLHSSWSMYWGAEGFGDGLGWSFHVLSLWTNARKLDNGDSSIRGLWDGKHISKWKPNRTQSVLITNNRKNLEQNQQLYSSDSKLALELSFQYQRVSQGPPFWVMLCHCSLCFFEWAENTSTCTETHVTVALSRVNCTHCLDVEQGHYEVQFGKTDCS